MLNNTAVSHRTVINIYTDRHTADTDDSVMYSDRAINSVSVADQTVYHCIQHKTRPS